METRGNSSPLLIIFYCSIYGLGILISMVFSVGYLSVIIFCIIIVLLYFIRDMVASTGKPFDEIINENWCMCNAYSYYYLHQNILLHCTSNLKILFSSYLLTIWILYILYYFLYKLSSPHWCNTQKIQIFSNEILKLISNNQWPSIQFKHTLQTDLYTPQITETVKRFIPNFKPR